ncbi:hypothetical protein [Nocardia thailandica]
MVFGESRNSDAPVVPLRPLTFPDMVRVTGRILLRHWHVSMVFTLAALVAGLTLLAVSTYVITQILVRVVSAGDSGFGQLLVGIVAGLIVYLVMLCAIGIPFDAAINAVTVTTADLAMRGAPVRLGEIIDAVRPRFAAHCRMMAAFYAILLGLGWVVPVLALLAGGLPALLLSFPLICCAEFALGILISLAPVVLTIEGGTVTSALTRSAALARPAFWRLVGLHLGWALGMSAALIAGGVTTVLVAWIVPGLALGILFVPLIFIVIALPMVRTAQVVIYTDLRLRTENYADDLATARTHLRNRPAPTPGPLFADLTPRLLARLIGACALLPVLFEPPAIFWLLVAATCLGVEILSHTRPLTWPVPVSGVLSQLRLAPALPASVPPTRFPPNAPGPQRSDDPAQAQPRDARRAGHGNPAGRLPLGPPTTEPAVSLDKSANSRPPVINTSSDVDHVAPTEADPRATARSAEDAPLTPTPPFFPAKSAHTGADAGAPTGRVSGASADAAPLPSAPPVSLAKPAPGEPTATVVLPADAILPPTARVSLVKPLSRPSDVTLIQATDAAAPAQPSDPRNPAAYGRHALTPPTDYRAAVTARNDQHHAPASRDDLDSAGAGRRTTPAAALAAGHGDSSAADLAAGHGDSSASALASSRGDSAASALAAGQGRSPAGVPPPYQRGPVRMPMNAASMTPPTPHPSGTRSPVAIALLSAMATILVLALVATIAWVLARQTAPTSTSADDDTRADAPAAVSCTSPPQLRPLRYRTTATGLVAVTEMRPGCSDGAVVAGDALRVRLADRTSTIAEGVVDFTGTPLSLPARGTATVEFLFPLGTFTRLPGTLGDRPDPTAQQVTAATGQTATITDLSTRRSTAPPVTTLISPLTAQPGTGMDREASALSALRTLVDADRAALQRDIAERWTPQISSKYISLVAPDIDGRQTTWTAAAILDQHLRLRLRYPQARLLLSEEWRVYDRPGWWITLAGPTYPDPEPAIAWCDAERFPPDECAAKLLSNSRDSPGTTRYRR